MGQVTGLHGVVPSIEPVVVTVHDSAAIVDDVEAVVGLKKCRQRPALAKLWRGPQSSMGLFF